MSETRELVRMKDASPDRGRELPAVTPLVDIYENDDEILLHADMPGVSRDDISINIDNGRLTLSGVRRVAAAGAAIWEEFGSVEYHRSFSVPQSIDVDKVHAELKDGVLRLHLPRSEAARPRQIEIRTA